MLSPPKFIHSVTPTSVGGSGNAVIWNVTYNALLVSEEHRRHPQTGVWLEGGPFCVAKEYRSHGTGRKARLYNNTVWWEGNTQGVAPCASGALPQLPDPNVEQLLLLGDDWGLRGRNRTRPGNPTADLIVAFKEVVSEGLPRIPFLATGVRNFRRGKKRLKRIERERSILERHGVLPIQFNQLPWVIKAIAEDFVSLGGEYLNVVFGWKPFINDLRRLYMGMRNVDRQIAQLRRNSGRGIRRRATLLDTRTSSQTRSTHNLAYYNVLGAPPNWFGSTGKTEYSQTTTTHEKIWFSAAYRYWIPDLASWQWEARARLALFGALPTPGVLYNATPWSWLADWFTDVGEIYQAVSPNAVPNLVTKYAYTMRHHTKVEMCSAHVTYPGADTRTQSGLGKFYGACDHMFSSVKHVETKTRGGGFQPFGPDQGWGDLSPYQLSILAALGLSRGHAQSPLG